VTKTEAATPDAATPEVRMPEVKSRARLVVAAVAAAIGFLPVAYQTTGLVLLVYVVLFLPLAQSSVRASAELVPRELSDVARSLGKSPLRAFVLTILPNLLPGIGAALARGFDHVQQPADRQFAQPAAGDRVTDQRLVEHVKNVDSREALPGQLPKDGDENVPRMNKRQCGCHSATDHTMSARLVPHALSRSFIRSATRN